MTGPRLHYGPAVIQTQRWRDGCGMESKGKIKRDLKAGPSCDEEEDEEEEEREFHFIVNPCDIKCNWIMIK